MFSKELSLNNPNKTIWKIERFYDNGELYEDNQQTEKTFYVQGTKDQLCKYLTNETGYDPENLVEVSKDDYSEIYCCHLGSIFDYYGPCVKATFSECDRGTKFSFYKENENEIIFAYVEKQNHNYAEWETVIYTATPTTLDEIITVL